MGSYYLEMIMQKEAKEHFMKAEGLNASSNMLYKISNDFYKLRSLKDAIEWAEKCVKKGGDQESKVYELLGKIFSRKK